MKKLILGLALASVSLVACQNPSLNTMEAGTSPEATGACQMDAGCGMEGEEAGCGMESMDAGCEMEAKEAAGGCCSAEAAPVSCEAEPN